MKTLHLLTIIILATVSITVSQTAFGSEPCPKGGYIHYGPSRQSIPCYLVSPASNLTLENQFGKLSYSNKLVYHGAVIVINQTVNKLELRDGEHLIVHPELKNIGNSSLTICSLWSPFFVEIQRQNGTIAYRDGPSHGALEFHCLFDHTLRPNGHFSETRPVGGFGPIMLDMPGNYTISSVTDFYYGDTFSNRTFVSSKPFPITVLPEKSVTITSLNDFPPPLKQQGKAGILPEGVKCNPGLDMIYHPGGKTAACVKPDIMTKLVKRGWTKPIPPITPFPLPIVVR